MSCLYEISSVYYNEQKNKYFQNPTILMKENTSEYIIKQYVLPYAVVIKIHENAANIKNK